MKKIAIITGASGGIGQIFFRELMKETLECKDLTEGKDNVKILPHKLTMKVWLYGIRKYLGG